MAAGGGDGSAGDGSATLVRAGDSGVAYQRRKVARKLKVLLAWTGARRGDRRSSSELSVASGAW
jgi:hypothetical protein